MFCPKLSTYAWLWRLQLPAATALPAWRGLPDELLLHILQLLRADFRDNARLCCKRWSLLLAPRPLHLRRSNKLALKQATFLAKLPSLQQMTLTSCTTVYAVALLSQLTKLSIEGTVAELAALAELPRLHTLRLEISSEPEAGKACNALANLHSARSVR